MSRDPGCYLPATDETYAATSWICCAVRRPLNAGIPPPPFATWCATVAASGFSWSRFGPTLPFEFASASVWQAVQLAVKTALPAAALPVPPAGAVLVVGALPTTVFGVGVVVLPEPQAATSSTSGARIPAAPERRMGRATLPGARCSVVRWGGARISSISQGARFT